MFTTRTEPVIRADVLRAFTAKRKARRQPSDLNVGSVVRTLLEEAIAPELAELYYQLLLDYETFFITKSTGPDLDARLSDWSFPRRAATRSHGYLRIFGTKYASGDVTASASATLSDASKTWTTNALTGKTIRITSGQGHGQVRTIASNTSTQVTVSVAWSTVPDASSTFEVYSTPTSDVSIPKGTLTYALSATGEQIRFETFRTPGVQTSGTATAGTSTSVTVSSAAWTANAFMGDMLVLDAGTGEGQALPILSNTATKLTVQGTFSPAPDNTTTFRVLRGTFPKQTASVVVPVRASVAGAAGNVAAGTVTRFVDAIEGLGGCTNVTIDGVEAEFVSGREVERDTEYRGRFFLYLDSLSRGTRKALRYGALSYVDASGEAPVHSVSLAVSGGAITMYVEDGSGTASADLVASVQARIDGNDDVDGWAAEGIPVTVTAGSAVGLTIVASLTLDDTHTLSDVQALVSENIRLYIDGLGLGDDVSWKALLTRCFVDGVIDVTLTLNGGTSTVSITDPQKAIITSLTVA